MVVSALYLAFCPIMNIVAISLIVMFMFAIAGIQLYAGQLQVCNDPLFPPNTALVTCVGNFTLNGSTAAMQRAIGGPRLGFDDFPLAMLTLFISSTNVGWPETMDALSSVTAVDYSPRRGASWWNAYFMVAYVAVARFVLLNLFTAVLWANYTLLARSILGFGLLTDRQREWIQSQSVLLHSKPLRSSLLLPDSHWRKLAIRIVESTGFTWFMVAILLLNAILLGAVQWHDSDWLASTIQYANIVFTFAFIIECTLGIVGRGIKLYWRLSWNRFDLFVTVASVIDVIVAALSSGTSQLSVFVSILRVTRVLRLVRLARRLPGIQVLISVLYAALPAFASIGGVLALTLFCYAVMGVPLFGDIDLSRTEGLNEHSNFRNVAQAAFVLFRTMTGGEWHLILWDTADPELGGGWWAYVYWISFNFIVSMIMLKLFVLVIVDEYLRRDRQLRNRTDEMLLSFQLAWACYDPHGTGFVRVDELRPLLLKLGSPLGLSPGCSFRDYLSFCNSLQLMTWQGYVNFHDVILALHRVTYGVGIPSQILDGVQSAPSKVRERIKQALRRKIMRNNAATLVRRAVRGSTAWFCCPRKPPPSPRSVARPCVSVDIGAMSTPHQNDSAGSPSVQMENMKERVNVGWLAKSPGVLPRRMQRVKSVLKDQRVTVKQQSSHQHVPEPETRSRKFVPKGSRAEALGRVVTMMHIQRYVRRKHAAAKSHIAGVSSISHPLAEAVGDNASTTSSSSNEHATLDC